MLDWRNAATLLMSLIRIAKYCSSAPGSLYVPYEDVWGRESEYQSTSHGTVTLRMSSCSRAAEARKWRPWGGAATRVRG